MSTNCISCVRNPRTGGDLLCDDCRERDALRAIKAAAANVVMIIDGAVETKAPLSLDDIRQSFNYRELYARLKAFQTSGVRAGTAGEAAPPDEELKARQLAALGRHALHPVVMEMQVGDLIGICGALQLALRHPGFAGSPTARNVRGFVLDGASAVACLDPLLRELLMMGFDSRRDEPVTEGVRP